MKTYTIDLDKATIIDKCIESDIETLIYESDGFFTRDQYIVFDCGFEVIINFKISVNGIISRDAGDYYTPAFVDIDVVDIDIEIIDAFVDGLELTLETQIESYFIDIIKRII